MADRITLEVARYRPELEAEPVMQSYEVPLRPDWAVLDGLNHIKDHLDGTLSYRWSCRMGICGSCGMTVNGEPKLTCATFLTDYAPGPVRVEPLGNFPVVRDLVVDIGDFMSKLPTVKPWLVRDEDKPLDEGAYLQTPDEMDEYQQFSMCINCMLCYSACPVYALDPQFVGPAAIALAQRYNLDSRDEGAEDRIATYCRLPEGDLGLHLRRRVQRGLPQGRRPGRRDPALQAHRGHPRTQGLPSCPGARDERDAPPVSPADIHLLVASASLVPRLRAPRAQQRLRRLVRRVPAAACQRDQRREREEYEQFLDWSGRSWVLVLNVVALLFVLLHAVTWFRLAPKAIVVRTRGRRVPPP